MQSIEQLNAQFGIADQLIFEAGQGGLVRARFHTAAADAEIYLYGAHVTAFQPHGQRPVLFVSRQAKFCPGKPIRGGVPVCFPWFGTHEQDPAAPMHGTVRLRVWEVEASSPTELLLATGEPPFVIRHRVGIGSSLTMALEVTNTSAMPARFEQALHSYFAVSDVRQVSIEGLAGAEYLDKTDGFKRKTELAGVMRLTQEPDRLYLNTRATCLITDPGWRRRLVIAKENSDSTVVWNPWAQRAQALADFGDEEWPAMLCIETVNARENAVLLPPGQQHRMQARVSVENL